MTQFDFIANCWSTPSASSCSAGGHIVLVLANCWRTLSASSCSACLQNASASILGCLPWSEGRTLNTGCFVRYSDINFLNPMPGNGIPRGTITVVIVAAVSSVGVLVIGGPDYQCSS
ncbi:unnamed protein product [Fraxinus pennsylvanica]|uniref:Gnk2-homologous domain-containing protein n=1 Tax=Fraxinus pennsylvanica TaxID=56036 RepID=A0AAD2DUJ0_9LAMI|nr:unnamed protein product [Fraxinus pennsylvanica]